MGWANKLKQIKHMARFIAHTCLYRTVHTVHT